MNFLVGDIRYTSSELRIFPQVYFSNSGEKRDVRGIYFRDSCHRIKTYRRLPYILYIA